MNGAPSALVSPGLWGFVAFFVLAIALYLLMRNMNARMRRMSYRAQELPAGGRGRGGRTACRAGDGPVAGEQPPGAGPGTVTNQGRRERRRTRSGQTARTPDR